MKRGEPPDVSRMTDAPPAKLILLSVSNALGSVLRGQLQTIERVTVTAVSDPLGHDGPRPDLIVFEVTLDTDHVAHQLLTMNASNRLIFIGPVNAALSRSRPQRNVDVRELSADVSVAEVVRVCRDMLSAHSMPATSFGSLGSSDSLAPEPSLPSLPSNPFELDVRGQPPNASLPALPAPLFPVSQSPSSKPSRRPSSGAPAPGPLSDTGNDPEFDLEPGLKALLDEAEQRLSMELSPRLTSPPEAPEELTSGDPFLLSAEVRAVLAEPVGRYGTLGRAVSHSGSPYSDFATRTGHGHTTHGPASPSPGSRSSNAYSRTGTHSYTGTHSSSGNRVPESSTELGSDPVRTDIGKQREVTRGDVPTNSDSSVRVDSSVRGDSRTGNNIDDKVDVDDFDQPLDNEPFVGADAGTLAPAEGNHSATTKPPAPPVSRRALLSPAVPPAPLLPKEHDPRPRARSPRPDEPTRPQAALRPPTEQPSHTGHRPISRDDAAQHRQTPVDDVVSRPNNDVIPTHRPGPRGKAPRVTENAPTVGATTPSSTADTDNPSVEPLQVTPTTALPAVKHTQPAAPKLDIAERSSRLVSELPPLGAGDALAIIARAIRTRYTGALVFESDGGVRRIVMRDGDFVTAASGVQTESLLAYLVTQGTLSAAIAHRMEHRLPQFGRHAGAALIAAGHLTQEQLWPCLRAHAEHIIANILKLTGGIANFEEQVPERLANEPAVFGGATGAEVLTELVRRVVAPNEAVRLLGGMSTRLSAGTAASLLDECALFKDELDALQRVYDRPLGEVLASSRVATLPSVLYALCQLKILKSETDELPQEAPPDVALDAQALRAIIANRKALVEEADYFELLGVSPNATAYDIGRAYLSLKRTFQRTTLLTAGITDLDDDVQLITSVLEEAYDILRDNTRRERYRKALQSQPS